MTKIGCTSAAESHDRNDRDKVACHGGNVARDIPCGFNRLFVVGIFLLIVFATICAAYSRDKVGHLTAALHIAPIPVVRVERCCPRHRLHPGTYATRLDYRALGSPQSVV